MIVLEWHLNLHNELNCFTGLIACASHGLPLIVLFGS